MNISNITPPQVWTSSSRSLTDIGSGALTPANTVRSSLAGAASVDLRTSPGIVGQLSIAAQTGAAATAAMAVDILDGVNSIVFAQSASAANAIVGASVTNCNTVGARIRNADATNAATYIIAQFLWTI